MTSKIKTIKGSGIDQVILDLEQTFGSQKTTIDGELPMDSSHEESNKAAIPGIEQNIKEILIQNYVLDNNDRTTIINELTEAVKKLNLHIVSPSLIHGLIDSKLKELGYDLIPRFDSSEEIMRNLSENALKVLEKRYLKRNEDGKIIETPEELFRRVAKTISEAELKWADEERREQLEESFFRIMVNLEFLPNSPTLMNAGSKLGQLSACFVLPVEDSMESIFEAIKHTALIHKSGGGTGFSFSRIRPKNDMVQSTKGISSGPLSFMNVFDIATETVKQGGTRRGANMAILRVDHPDILEFIKVKTDNKKLNNFNLSVALTDKFMEALEKNTEYELINPRKSTAVSSLKAREVMDEIVKSAWSSGEPGIVFIDEINRKNPTPQLGEIESTNPCGEQPLLPYESCNLGSVNLGKMVKKQKGCNVIDYKRLKDIVNLAVRFLDDVIEMNRYPLERIRDNTLCNRKIGLGVMGFADMLIRLNVPYNSQEALGAARTIMSFISKEAREASRKLALERGAFPNFGKSAYGNGGTYELRNATTTTIAPTGSISIIANCSSGIEPIFAVSFIRNVLDNEKLLEVHPLFEEITKEKGIYSRELMNSIAEEGSLKEIQGIPEDLKNLFVTAHDISPEFHIEMQAAFQEYTDNAVSKTVNFPKHASKDDVYKVFLMAYKKKCKGVTIYRDGSRDQQVLYKHGGDYGSKGGEQQEKGNGKRARPRFLRGKTIEMTTGCGSLFVTVNEDEQGLFELFNTMGKAGGCAASQSEAIGRLVSLAWRTGIKPESIIRQLMGISCHKPHGLGESRILSCSDAIAKAIQLYMNPERPVVRHDLMSGACPDCGGVVEYQGGCMICRVCGYSECG